MNKAKIVLLFALLCLGVVCAQPHFAMAQDEELGALDELDEELGALEGEADEDVDLDQLTAAATARKHPSLLAVSVSFEHMIPLNVLKELVYDINDLKEASFGYGAGVRLYVLDGLALSVTGRTATVGFADDRPGEMDVINRQLDGEDTLSPDAGMKMDGLSIGVTAYVGKQIMPDSNFNPYVSGSLLYYDWAVTEDGRDGDLLSYQGKPLEGKDAGVGIGIGTEYALSDRLLLDAGLTWNFLLTGDEVLYDGFNSPNNSQYWTNTHWWGLSIGLVLGL